MFKRVNLFIVALCCILLSSAAVVRAAENLDADNVDKTLSQLEYRFFEHQYDNDSTIDRLERIEEFVYGSTQTGAVDDRLKRIVSTIPGETMGPESEGNATTVQNKTTNEDNGDKQPPGSQTRNPFDYSSYPRVTTLEQELLGRTYQTEHLSVRLARLETKAFGAPCTGSDLSQRVDLLDDYAERHDLYGDRKIANTTDNTVPFAPYRADRHRDDNDEIYTSSTNSPRAQQVYTGGSGTFIGSVEERISMMEAEVFHRTYTERSIGWRLKKLEKHVLPNDNIANIGESEQVVRLWDTLHPNEKNQVASLANGNNQLPGETIDSKPHYSWLHKLASSVGSLASNGMSSGMGPPAAYSSYSGPGYIPSLPLSPPGSSSNTPYYGSRFIGGSFGPGAGPMGLPVGFW